MHDCLLYTLERFKCLLYYMLSGLGEHLNRNVIRDEVIVYQFSEELILCFRCCRKADFDLFETDLNEILEELHLFVEAHRHDQRLVAVSEIDAAPDRRLLDVILFYPFVMRLCRRKISNLVFIVILHYYICPFFNMIRCRSGALYRRYRQVISQSLSAGS